MACTITIRSSNNTLTLRKRNKTATLRISSGLSCARKKALGEPNFFVGIFDETFDLTFE